FGLDSEFDYDPFWARCLALRVAPTCHQPGMGGLGTSSPSNFSHNHIHHFAWGDEALCKALFFGGVTRRFPGLNFAFLEGGVAWATSLYADLVARWEKRGPEGLANIDPANLDVERLMDLIDAYAPERARPLRAAIRHQFTRPQPRPEDTNDFAATGITRAE